MVLVMARKVLPDCVAYLRPKQLIKLSSNLFVYFFEWD